jgi:hypothetical protein
MFVWRAEENYAVLIQDIQYRRPVFEIGTSRIETLKG